MKMILLCDDEPNRPVGNKQDKKVLFMLFLVSQPKQHVRMNVNRVYMNRLNECMYV